MDIKLRKTVTEADKETVRKLVLNTGFFRKDEVPVAVSLVTDTLRDPASGYLFIFAESEGSTVGYAAYGEIPGTLGSYDLYWVAVQSDFQRMGIGKVLVKAVEDEVKKANGRHLYISTSDIDLYKPTRKFYEKVGYDRVATLQDYFAPGDAQVIYRKIFR